MLKQAFMENRGITLGLNGEFLRMIAERKIESCRDNPKELRGLLRFLNETEEDYESGKISEFNRTN